MVIAVALSLTFVVASPLSSLDDKIYSNYRSFWLRFHRDERLPDDQLLDIRNATIAIFGMGRVGSGAYDKMRELHGDTVVGMDFDAECVQRHQEAGRNVMRGDPSDADFWDIINKDHGIELVMLTLPNLEANVDALEQLHEIGFKGRVAATARYPDEEEPLRNAGATAVFNIYAEAGAGFAGHVEANQSAR